MSRKHTIQQCGSFRAQVPDAHLVNEKKKKKNQNRALLVGNDKLGSDRYSLVLLYLLGNLY